MESFRRAEEFANRASCDTGLEIIEVEVQPCAELESSLHIEHIMQQNDIAIPILPSRSVDDTLTFFRRLGFEGKICGGGDYAILTRGAVELHFFTHRELIPAESSAMCYIRVSEVESIYRAFALAQLP